MISLDVRAGRAAGRRLDVEDDAATIGRDPSCGIALDDDAVADRHARLVTTASGLLLEDLGSGRGTARIREGDRTEVVPSERHVVLRPGDLIELGRGTDAAVLSVVSTGEAAGEAHVLTLRRVEDASADPAELTALGAELRRIGAAVGLDEVLSAVADAALALVPKATHATLVLRDDGGEDGEYLPVLTRVRGASGEGPVPVARAVFRKVLEAKAAVLAADAPKEVGQSSSLLGANIRSTIAVPLFRGDDLVGVLQVDNRDAPGVLQTQDLERLAVLATSATLAVAHARLAERLRVAEAQLRRENSYLKGREAERRGGGREILGRARRMMELLAQLDKVADTRVSVLVEGETGVGKELVASALHYRSRRRDKLFVTQNCAALPENLLESELFGHRRGAFTGAVDDKKGLFELAHGGTLFLDEVGEMALALQAKLLRVLQEGEVRPVGSTAVRHVDVRIVAATNRDLAAEVQRGTFREDLFYRLRVFPLRVPALRERREDIPLLAGAFLQKYSRELGKATDGFAQQTMEALVAYDWPGNVRELENEVQRLVIQVDPGGIVSPDMLSPHLRKVEGLIARSGMTKGSLRDMMDSVEKSILLEALRDHGQNKTACAKTLGITREGLHKKLRALGIG